MYGENPQDPLSFLDRRFRIGRVAGVTVYIHILYIVWMVFQFLPPSGGAAMTAIWLGMLFVAVLLHEYGHCLAAKSQGGSGDQILMWPLGGLAFTNAPMTPRAQFITVACGPLVNVGLGAVCAAVLISTTGDPQVVSLNPFRAVRFARLDPWQFYVGLFYWMNLSLFCFNMLPIFPMDGGQLFRVLLWPHLGLRQATMIATQVGMAGAVLLAVWGITLADTLLITIAIFGGITAFQHYQLARHGMLQEEWQPMRYDPPRSRRTGWWQRLAAWLRQPPRRGASRMNPNPGAWEARQEEDRQREREIDRILKKVHDQGLQSLTYVERQTLERATRERQEREARADREFRS